MFLKGFARDGKTLSVRWRDGRSGTLPVSKATVIRDFYDTQKTIEPDDSVETWFSHEIENSSARVLAQARDGSLPAGHDVDTLARFIAFQMVRGASFRRSQMEIADTAGRLHYAALVIGKLIDDDPDLTDDEVQRLAVELGPRTPPELLVAKRLSVMRTMVREGHRIAKALPSMHWSLLTADDRLLVTSDTPVVTRGPDGEYTDGPQLLPDGFEVLVPVSPSRLLAISPVPTLGGGATLTEQFARDVNERQARGADELVMHHPDMAWPTDLVLLPEAPRPPTPRVTMRRSRDNEPRTEMNWPKIGDDGAERAMRLLGGDPPLPPRE